MAFFIYSGYRNHISVTLQLYFLHTGVTKVKITFPGEFQKKSHKV